MQIHKLLSTCGSKFQLWQENKVLIKLYAVGRTATATPERYKSVATELHQFRSRARVEFGAPGCGCSPTHDSDSILSANTAAQHTSRLLRLDQVRLGPGYWDKPIASRQPDRP